MGEQWWGLVPMSISSELSHPAVPVNFLAYGKKPDDPSEFRTRELSAPSRTLYICATLARSIFFGNRDSIIK